MTQDKNNRSSYKKWLASDESRKNVLKSIAKSGIPLELKARKVLKDHGFQVGSMRYFEDASDYRYDEDTELGKGIWRELDIAAFKKEGEFYIESCNINFVTNIVAECKFSSEKDLLVFEHLEPNRLNLDQFPLFINCQNILPKPQHNNFELPMIAERVIAFDHTKSNKKDDNYSDKVIHNASEQILSAMKYLIPKWSDAIVQHYNKNMNNSQLAKEWRSIPGEEIPYVDKGYRGGEITPQFIDEFLMSNFEPKSMIQDYPIIDIIIYYPLLIIDESQGIIKAKLDDSYDAVDLEDLGLCTYAYMSENTEEYSVVLDSSFVFPIIICTSSTLHQVVELISNGVKKMIGIAKKRLLESPQLIPREIMFNYVLQSKATFI